MSMLYHLNYVLFQDLNSQAGHYPWLDTLMIFCANYLIFFFPVILLLLWGIPLAWRHRPVSTEEAGLLQRRRAVVLWIAIACVLSFALNLLIEQFVFEPRPFITHKVHVLISHAPDASFPSDHTAWSFAVFSVLLFALLPSLLSARHGNAEGISTGTEKRPSAGLPLLLIVVSFVVACSIGLARVFVGVHYPGDVLGGALDGLLAGLIATVLLQVLSRPTNAVLQFARNVRLA